MAKTKTRPSEILRRLGGWVGGSIGQAESLAGINVQSEAERKALWDQFKHLYSGDSQVLIRWSIIALPSPWGVSVAVSFRCWALGVEAGAHNANLPCRRSQHFGPYLVQLGAVWPALG